MDRFSLDNAGWTVRAVGDLSAVPAALRGREVVARVPGCVHTDLMRAGLIPDPLVGMNEREVQWIGETDWEYRASFEVDARLLKHDRVDLVCEGLDTIAEVRLNGALVGRAANMFHPHRFDVRSSVRAGANELSITFRSPLKHIRAEEQRLGKRPVNGDWEPYIYIRKAACSFGWDWAPKLAGCGLWKSVGLEAWSGVRIAAVRPSARRVNDQDWALDVGVDLEWSEQGRSLRYPVISSDLGRGRWNDGGFIAGEDSVPVAEYRSALLNPGVSRFEFAFKVQQPLLWWPAGLGTRELHELRVFVGGFDKWPYGTGTGLSQRRVRLGFREVKLKTAHDEFGSAFTLEVNGREVFCKGANWIPEGSWPGQVSRETYRERLQQAAAANMNMLRVWGGGYYEDDAFYEICDELGIMVWQDFMFACAMYPEEEPYPALIEAEARHQVARLSSHPSVVLWCGGNECTWAHDAWGNAPGERPWRERLQGKSWGEKYYAELQPAIVRESGAAYWPNSPYPQNSAEHGDRHTWDARGEGYRKIVPRFCSEFGAQSPSNYATLASVLTPEDLKVGSPAMEHRQRGTGGTRRHIDEAIAETFREPRDFDEWHYLAQLTQARAMKTGIEWMRVNRPRCMGALVWQFNECWPGMSWSLVDAQGRGKLAYHAVRDAFRSRLLTIQLFEGRPWLCVVNDEATPSKYIVDVRRMTFEGEALAGASVEVGCEGSAAARGTDLLGLLGPPTDATREFIVADTIGRRETWFFLPDRDLRYPPARVEMVHRHGTLGHECLLRAEALIRDMAIEPDGVIIRNRKPGEGSRVLSMLPGEEKSIGFLSDEYVAHLGLPKVLPHFMCANGFGAGT